MTELRFDGRVVIVTGAGRGLGRAYALLLAARGAAVLVNDAGVGASGEDPGPAPADDCVGTIRAAGGVAAPSYHSVASVEGAEAIVAQALREFGRVDALINNAGIGLDKPFGATSAADFRRLLDVHFMGTALMCLAAWEPMRAAGYGRIVNTVSSAIFGYANCSAYSAAKGAILGFSRSLALEAAAAKIAVNCIAPAAATRMTAGVSMSAEQREWMERALPAAAVAPVAAFLAHESCSLNGEVLVATGGRVRRCLLGETAGARPEPLTLDSVAQELGAILDPGSFRAFATTDESMTRAAALDAAAAS